MDLNPTAKYIDLLDSDMSESIGDLPHHLASEGDVQVILGLRDNKAQKVIDLLDKV